MRNSSDSGVSSNSQALRPLVEQTPEQFRSVFRGDRRIDQHLVDGIQKWRGRVEYFRRHLLVLEGPQLLETLQHGRAVANVDPGHGFVESQLGAGILPLDAQQQLVDQVGPR